jgi:hypothetical protein
MAMFRLVYPNNSPLQSYYRKEVDVEMLLDSYRAYLIEEYLRCYS